MKRTDSKYLNLEHNACHMSHSETNPCRNDKYGETAHIAPHDEVKDRPTQGC